KVLEIEVPEEEVIREIKSAYDSLSKDAVLPGFRRGKVPFDLIKQHYDEQVKKEVLDKLIQSSYRDAVREAKFHPVSQAKIDGLQFEEGKPLVFKASVEVKAPLKLGAYTGLQAKRPSALE